MSHTTCACEHACTVNPVTISHSPDIRELTPMPTIQYFVSRIFQSLLAV